MSTAPQTSPVMNWSPSPREVATIKQQHPDRNNRFIAVFEPAFYERMQSIRDDMPGATVVMETIGGCVRLAGYGQHIRLLDERILYDSEYCETRNAPEEIADHLDTEDVPAIARLMKLYEL